MSAVQLASLFIITLFSGITFFLFIDSTDPARLNSFSLFIFYLSLLLFSFGVLSVLGLLSRRFLFRQLIKRRAFITTLRQSFLIALFIVISLALESFSLFSFKVSAILLVALLGIELFISYRGREA